MIQLVNVHIMLHEDPKTVLGTTLRAGNNNQWHDGVDT